MANQRGAGQTMLGFWADTDLVEKIDSIRPDGVSRSNWLRSVVAQYLRKKGIKVPDAFITNQPDRVGVGGPKPKRLPAGSLADQVISSKASLADEDPAVAEAAASLALPAMRKALAADRAHQRKGKAASPTGKTPPPAGESARG
jgi:hypothetical protein